MVRSGKVKAALLVAHIHHFKQLRVFDLLHKHTYSFSLSLITVVWVLKQLSEPACKRYLYEFPLFLVYLFTFARGEDLLHQFLHNVVVHCVGIDVTTELVKVHSLHTSTKKCANPQILYVLLAFSAAYLPLCCSKNKGKITIQSYLGVQKEVTVCRFSISSSSPDLLNVTLKALDKHLPVNKHCCVLAAKWAVFWVSAFD